MPSFSLSALQAILPRDYVTDAWVTEEADRATLIKLYRDYVKGEHDAKLTTEMKNMLRLSSTTANELNNNYCNTVVATMSGRTTVDGMNGDSEAATQWFSEIMKLNRFDALQIDVHRAIMTCGDNYVMVSWDKETGRVMLSNEPAYDGTEGILVIYDAKGVNLEAAIKIWQDVDESGVEFARINVYYPDKVCKYSYKDGFGEKEEYPWLDTKRQPLGVPIIHFKDKVNFNDRHGTSQLVDAVPLQNVLNRTIVSMVMTSELSAFSLIESKGVNPPAALTPGAFLIVPMPEGAMDDSGAANLLSAMGFKRMEQATLVPFISQAEFIINQIATVTSTPIPELMGSLASSGEALKQRESGLLGKVREFQVKVGNQWEDVATLAHKVQSAFGTKQPPANEYWTTHWKPAELRNDNEVVDRILKIADKIPDREFLRLLAPMFEWDADKIKEMLEEMASQETARIETIGRSLIPPMNSQEFEVQENSGIIEGNTNNLPVNEEALETEPA